MDCDDISIYPSLLGGKQLSSSRQELLLKLLEKRETKRPGSKEDPQSKKFLFSFQRPDDRPGSGPGEGKGVAKGVARGREGEWPGGEASAD